MHKRIVGLIQSSTLPSFSHTSMCMSKLHFSDLPIDKISGRIYIVMSCCSLHLSLACRNMYAVFVYILEFHWFYFYFFVLSIEFHFLTTICWCSGYHYSGSKKVLSVVLGVVDRVLKLILDLNVAKAFLSSGMVVHVHLLIEWGVQPASILAEKWNIFKIALLVNELTPILQPPQRFNYVAAEQLSALHIE